jgi:hypothetical protein
MVLPTRINPNGIKLMQREDALDETCERAEGDAHPRRASAASTSAVRSEVSQSQGHGPSSTPDYVAQFTPTTALCIVFHNPIGGTLEGNKAITLCRLALTFSRAGFRTK